MSDRSNKRVHGPDAAGAGTVEGIEASELLGACPSCGADLHIAYVTHPRTGRHQRAILHVMPFCTYYGKTSPDVIERAVLRERARN